MGCGIVRSLFETVLYEFWNSLPIKNTEIKSFVEDVLGLFKNKPPLAEVWDKIKLKYFTNEDEIRDSKKENGLLHLFEKNKHEPEVFFSSLLLICKENKTQFKDGIKQIFAAIKGDELTNITFKDNKILKPFLIKVLHSHLDTVSFHMAPHLANQEDPTFVQFSEEAFQFKYRHRYITHRIKDISKNYSDFDHFLENSYHDFNHNTVRDCLVCDLQEEQQIKKEEHLQLVTNKSKRFKDKEKEILDKLKTEEEETMKSLEEEYEKTQKTKADIIKREREEREMKLAEKNVKKTNLEQENLDF